MSLEIVTLLVSLGATTVGLGMWDRLRRKRALDSLHATPRLTARSAVGSTVIAIGRVRTIEDRELDAPLSGRPCVAYSARVYRGSIDAPGWGVVNVTPFRIEREDGSTVLVDATQHVEFRFPPLPLPPDAPERCDAFAVALGLHPKVRKHGTYEEIIVLEDMRIAVRGVVVENGEQPRISGTPQRPILIAVPF
jgi:hypothetical protein